MTHTSRLACLAILLTWSVLAFAKDPDYTVKELALLPGTMSGEALAINARGQIAGYQCCHFFLPGVGVPFAVMWDNGSVIELPSPPPPPATFAYDINNRGQIVGALGDRLVLLWENGTATEIAPPPGATVAAGHGINERGQIVGAGSTGPGSSGFQAMLWDNGTMVALGVLPGDSQSQALAINNSGQIVGWGQNSTTQLQRAFLWEKGNMSELPGLAGQNTQALAINERGQVVGYSGQLPVMWEKGTRIALETLPPLTSGRALGINNSGQIVGFLQSPGSSSRVPVLWDNGKAMALPMLPPVPGSSNDYVATDINNSGTIVGSHQVAGFLRPLVWVRNAQSGN